jgi:hypothetical protein
VREIEDREGEKKMDSRNITRTVYSDRDKCVLGRSRLLWAKRCCVLNNSLLLVSRLSRDDDNIVVVGHASPQLRMLGDRSCH